MDDFKIDCATLYPTLNLALNTVDNMQYAVALTNAYNSWLKETFLHKDDRLNGNILIAPQDPAAAAEEINRLADDDDFVGVQNTFD